MFRRIALVVLVGVLCSACSAKFNGFYIGVIEEKEAQAPLTYFQNKNFLVTEGYGGYRFDSLYSVVGAGLRGRGANWIDPGPVGGYQLQECVIITRSPDQKGIPIDYLVIVDTERQYGYSSQNYAVVTLKVQDCRTKLILATQRVRDNVWRRFDNDGEAFAAAAAYAVATLQ